MNHLFALSLSLLLGASQASAALNQGLEKPVYTGQMKAIESQRGFKEVKSAVLTITQSDRAPGRHYAPTGMTLEYIVPARMVGGKYYPSENRNYTLVITQTKKDSCGSIHYVASLPQSNPEPSDRNSVGARFSVALTDHRGRQCEDFRPYMWEASVRQGFGWCGTEDSTMTLVGDPEFVPAKAVE